MPLIIRKMRESDLGPLCVLLSDPRVMLYLEPPYSREQTIHFIESAALCDSPLIYAAEEDDAFLGYVICHDYDDTSLEIGWVLFPWYWGKGYASRLTELLIERGKALHKHLVIECAPEQHVTQHIAEKYGFVYEGHSYGLDVYRLYCL